jgi:hypothetical protein
MSQPQVFTLTPANVSLTGFASNVTGATWTLTATSSGDNLAHSVTIRNDSITDHSAKTAVLTGTDPDGNAQTETLNLPGVSATVTSTKYFKTLTSVVPSATIGADTMDIGWGNKFSALTYVLNWRNSNAARIHVDVTGTISYSVQQASGNPGTMTAPSQSLNWQAITAFDSKTAGVLGAAAIGATAIRAIANSYTDGATLIMYVNLPWDVVRA